MIQRGNCIIRSMFMRTVIIKLAGWWHKNIFVWLSNEAIFLRNSIFTISQCTGEFISLTYHVWLDQNSLNKMYTTYEIWIYIFLRPRIVQFVNVAVFFHPSLISFYIFVLYLAHIWPNFANPFKVVLYKNIFLLSITLQPFSHWLFFGIGPEYLS